jgi:hypothetical protein
MREDAVATLIRDRSESPATLGLEFVIAHKMTFRAAAASLTALGRPVSAAIIHRRSKGPRTSDGPGRPTKWTPAVRSAFSKVAAKAEEGDSVSISRAAATVRSLSLSLSLWTGLHLNLSSGYGQPSSCVPLCQQVNEELGLVGTRTAITARDVGRFVAANPDRFQSTKPKAVLDRARALLPRALEILHFLRNLGDLLFYHRVADSMPLRLRSIESSGLVCGWLLMPPPPIPPIVL